PISESNTVDLQLEFADLDSSDEHAGDIPPLEPKLPEAGRHRDPLVLAGKLEHVDRGDQAQTGREDHQRVAPRCSPYLELEGLEARQVGGLARLATGREGRTRPSSSAMLVDPP